MTETIFILNINDAIETARAFRKQGHTLMRVSRGHWWVGDADMIYGKPPSCKIFIDSFSIVPQGEAILYQKPSFLHTYERPTFAIDNYHPFVSNLKPLKGTTV